MPIKSDEAESAQSKSRLATVLSFPVSNKFFQIVPAVAAVIGFAIHASLLFKPNLAGYVYPQTRSLLLTVSLLFFSLEGILLQFRSES